MPISKNGKQYFTAEQLSFALGGNIGAIDYAKSAGYDLEKSGNYYYLKEHDSLMFFPNGTWHWYSKGIGGDTLSFLVEYEKHSFKEAVLLLNGENILGHSEKSRVDRLSQTEVMESRSFYLPPKAVNQKKLFAYLIKSRGLDADVVQQLVKEHKLYLSAVTSNSGKEINNIVFVGFDENGIAKNAYQRSCMSISDREPFKRDVLGSDKTFPFHMTGSLPIVKVYEAAIDAMSHACLENIDVQAAPHRIALGGINTKPFIWFLEQHPELTAVYLALDNDEAGREGAEKLVAICQERDIPVYIDIPNLKDWNEDLVNCHTILPRELEL